MSKNRRVVSIPLSVPSQIEDVRVEFIAAKLVIRSGAELSCLERTAPEHLQMAKKSMYMVHNVSFERVVESV